MPPAGKKSKPEPGPAPASTPPALIDDKPILQKVESALVTWKDKGEKALAVAEKIVVEDDESYNKAIGILSTMKGEASGIEVARKSFTDPLKKLAEKVHGMFKVIGDPYAQADAKIRGKALTWYEAKQKAIEAENERRRLEAEAAEKKRLIAETNRTTKKGSPVMPQAPPPAPPPVAAQPKTVTAIGGGSGTMKETWDFKIIDPNILPREYLVPNEPFIRSAVVQGGKREIPGVHIFKKTGLSITAS